MYDDDGIIVESENSGRHIVNEVHPGDILSALEEVAPAYIKKLGVSGISEGLMQRKWYDTIGRSDGWKKHPMWGMVDFSCREMSNEFSWVSYPPPITNNTKYISKDLGGVL